MKRVGLVLLAVAWLLLVWTACSVRQPAGLGQTCDRFEGCPSPYVCVNQICVARCTFPGDCDPNFVCLDEVCVPSCEGPQDCPEGVPCSPSSLAGTSFCGRSTALLCGSTEGCPTGYVCLGSRCQETCSADADCPMREACFDRGGYGQCFTGDRPGDFDRPMPDAGMDMDLSPNNIPTDRNCNGRPDDYCSETFGSDEICLDGRCQTAPGVYVILDVSSGESCDLPGDMPGAAGVDLIGVADDSGEGTWAQVAAVSIEDNGYDSGSGLFLAGVPECIDGRISTGCGGWVALTTREPIVNGDRLTVFENGDTCQEGVVERYRVFVCTDERAVTLARDLTSCTILVGEGAGQRRFTVSY